MRRNLRIKIGTYVGNGTIQDITDVGGRPDLLIVKGGANIACFRTRHMRQDSSAYLAGNTANFAGGIIGFLDQGFRVGSDAKANANGTTYFYIAIWGSDAQSVFDIFTFLGNGSDARQLTASDLKFQPDIVNIKGDTAQNGSVRTSPVTGDNAWHFSGSADAANEIQNLVPGGAELGTSARVNGAGLEYYGWALKAIPGIISVFTFTGNGVDGRLIDGLGMRPDAIFLKNGVLTNAGVLRTSDMVGDSTYSLASAGSSTDMIQTIEDDGFTVGANNSVNADGNVIWGFALKEGEFTVPISRVAA